ncbi:hypothetical protein [Microbacterium sp. PA5]
MQWHDGRRVVDESILVAWWVERMNNWPTHQYRLRREQQGEQQ